MDWQDFSTYGEMLYAPVSAAITVLATHQHGGFLKQCPHKDEPVHDNEAQLASQYMDGPSGVSGAAQ